MLKAWTSALALAAVTLGAPAEAKKTTASYTSLTVFGDSLVDAGNFFAERGTPSPLQGYAAGRWTNGYDYTDLISFNLFGAPTVASVLGGNNYAYGGARVLDTSAYPPHLPDQYASFQARLTAGTASVDPNGLVVLNFGANDIFNVASTANSPLFNYNGDQQAVIRDAALNYAGFVKTLNDAGVRNILITDFPVSGALATYGNGILNTALDGLQLNADTTVFRFSYLDAFGRILANPGAYGIAPFTQTGRCNANLANVQAGCVGFFSFDGTHPVAAVQGALFTEVNRQFALIPSVPEPATWGLMILGFAMVGAAARRPRVRVRYLAA